MSDDSPQPKEARLFTLALVEQCVRNSMLENLHAGTTPGSATGDYSDVKVVTPYGEIPWNQLSRISDEEMKALMIDVSNKVFTFLMRAEHLITLGPAQRWDKPKLDSGLLNRARHRAAERGDGQSPGRTDPGLQGLDQRLG